MPPKKSNIKTSKVDAKTSKVDAKAADKKKTSVSKSKEPVTKQKVPSPPKTNSRNNKSAISASKGKSKKDPSPQPLPQGKRSKSDIKDDKKPTKTQSKENIVKVITKGGAAVDALVPNKDQYRVLIDGGKVYSATLNQSNVDHNNNKFYIIQVLQNQKTGAYAVWNRWGRVGVPGQNALKNIGNKDMAIRDFMDKHRAKTQAGNYVQIQIKYDDEEENKKPEPTQKKKQRKNVASKIDNGLQKLINLIFDVQVMNNTMKEIGYDAKKMPLGKLGDSTIKQAYAVLNDLMKAIKGNNTSEYGQLSSKFYTLIPHDFGFQKMSNFIINNEQKVKEKIKMLQAISDMKITTKLLEQKDDDNLNVVDQNYKKLGCEIKTISPSSEQYKLMKEYFDNTKGSYTSVKVGEIYQVCRPNEQKSYNTKIGNNMLLWHGSRISNFVGILSQGLRIAPPQAPVSGYLFGKGIYLADMAQKSINYCRSYGSQKALILLIEGAIGQPNILLNSNYQAKQLMEKNKKHSTKCHGSKAPPQSSYVKHKNVIVPKGKAQPTGSGSYMGHNQYIVYNMDQARIKYIIQMDMK